MLSKLLVIAMWAFVTVVASSTLYRLHKTKPIMKPHFPEPRFSETWCSGRSDRNALARSIVAKNFLWVVVTEDDLQVSPHFPLTLMFLPETFGLDHRIPGKSIMDVRETSSELLGRGVLIQYRHATGDEERLELQVNDVATLKKALGRIRTETPLVN
jgi:hypothetical protein